jgi:hypothetical protein
MNRPKLAIVPVAHSLAALTPAVLYARQARAYLKISSVGLCKPTRTGIVNRYTHLGGKRPFYLKHERDAYLHALPRYRMLDREASPNSAEGSSE